MGGSQVDGARFSAAVPSNGATGNGDKLEMGSSTWTWGKASLLLRWESTGTDCSERLWSLLWRYSKTASMLCSVTCCIEPALSGCWTTWSSVVPSSPYNPVLLWCTSAVPSLKVTPPEHLDSSWMLRHQQGSGFSLSKNFAW